MYMSKTCLQNILKLHFLSTPEHSPNGPEEITQFKAPWLPGCTYWLGWVP